jgi:hypothetical protein
MMNSTVLYMLAKQHVQDLADESARRRLLAAARRSGRGAHVRTKGRVDR